MSNVKASPVETKVDAENQEKDERERSFDDDDHEDGDEEEEDDEEDEEDENNFVVAEVTDVKIGRNGIEFKTTWETDNTNSWEPLCSFPNGIEHAEIQKYKAKNPEKFNLKWQKHLERRKPAKREHKNWYISEETLQFEKPDSNVKSREVKMLSDPNRIEDPKEAFLKAYDSGPRMSRSKTRELCEGLQSSSADSSISIQPSPQSVIEKKKRAPGAGRKRKEKEVEPVKDICSTSAQKHTSAPKQRIRQSAKDKTESAEKKNSEESKFIPSVSNTSSMKTLGRIPKKFTVKLNSSDSSEEEIDEPIERIKKRKKVVVQSDSESSRSLSPQPKKVSAEKKPINIKVKKTQAPIACSLPPEPQTFREPVHKRPSDQGINRKRLPSSLNFQSTEPIKAPEVSYSNEQDETQKLEEALKKQGISLCKESLELISKKNLEKRQAARDNTIDLYQAIVGRDIHTLELLLLESSPERVHDVVARSYPLHQILVHTYTMQKQRIATEREQAERLQACEQVFRAITPYLPISVLSIQNPEKNTMLHCAIHASHTTLSKYLIDIGSPLHLQNVHKCTAVEAALMMRKTEIFELLLKNGGTFHYLIGNNLERFEDEHYDKARKDILGPQCTLEDRTKILGVANNIYRQIESVFNSIRGSSLRISHYEVDTCPIVTFPRGKLLHCGETQTIQFRIPQNWLDLDMVTSPQYEFMLAVLPMDYYVQDGKFVGKLQKTNMLNPLIFDEECPHYHSIYYDATRAIYQRKELLKREESDIKPSLYYLTIQFDPQECLSFVATQLIRCQKKNPVPHNPSMPPVSPGHYSSPGTSTPRYTPSTPRV